MSEKRRKRIYKNIALTFEIIIRKSCVDRAISHISKRTCAGFWGLFRTVKVEQFASYSLQHQRVKAQDFFESGKGFFRSLIKNKWED